MAQQVVARLLETEDDLDSPANVMADLATGLKPRFVWNIGSISEVYPDMPESSAELVLWDRQERKAAVTVAAEYANAMCLERSHPGHSPFTTLEEWLNSLDREDLDSEGLP